MKRARKGRQCPLCGRSIPPDSRRQRQCNSASRREGGQGHGRPDDRHGRDKPRRRVAQISPVRPVTEDGPVDVVLTRTSSESDGCGRPGPCWDGEAESADRAAELGERRLGLLSAGVPEPWCNRILSKVELAWLAERTGLHITVCHFPPGTSKWNKIEHRLWKQH